MAEKHDTIRVRNLEDFEDYPIATGDYLVVATSDPDQKKQTLKATIADVVSIYLDKIEEDSNSDSPPTREITLPPNEDGTPAGEYELDNRDITVANLEEIAGFGLKVEEFCMGKDENDNYYSIPCTIPSSENPDIQIHNPEVAFKTKKLAVDSEEASSALEIKTIGLTDSLMDYITKYEYNEETNTFDRTELPKQAVTYEAGLAKSIDYYIGMFLQYGYPLTGGWWSIEPSDSFPNFNFGVFLPSELNAGPISTWIFKGDILEWQYIGGVSIGKTDFVTGFWFWTETFGWYWFNPRTYPWVWVNRSWGDREHVGWVYLHHDDQGNEEDLFYIFDSNAPIEEQDDNGIGPLAKWAKRTDDPFNTDNNSNDTPGDFSDAEDITSEEPAESPSENDPEPRP